RDQPLDRQDVEGRIVGVVAGGVDRDDLVERGQVQVVDVDFVDQAVPVGDPVVPGVVAPIPLVGGLTGQGADVADRVGRAGDATGASTTLDDEEGEAVRRVDAARDA